MRELNSFVCESWSADLLVRSFYFDDSSICHRIIMNIITSESGSGKGCVTLCFYHINC